MSIDDTRFTMLMLTAFAAASLLLTGIGIYGTLAYFDIATDPSVAPDRRRMGGWSTGVKRRRDSGTISAAPHA